MTEWTQEALRAEARKRLNATTIGSGYTLDSSVTLLVAELIGRCEQPPVDPFREMLTDAMGAAKNTNSASDLRNHQLPVKWNPAITLLRERFEAMLAERMGK